MRYIDSELLVLQEGISSMDINDSRNSMPNKVVQKNKG